MNKTDPDYALRIAVLQLAIVDAVTQKNRFGTQARRWISSNKRPTKGMTYFTFIGICEDLNVSPERIRRFVESKPDLDILMYIQNSASNARDLLFDEWSVADNPFAEYKGNVTYAHPNKNSDRDKTSKNR